MSTGPLLELPEVTLCALDTRAPDLALAAIGRCRTHIRFGRSLLLGHGQRPTPWPEGVDWVDVGPIRSAAEYSSFMLGQLLPLVQTSHVLVVQWDGFVAHADRWDPAFLGVDYLGAPWGKAHNGHHVGNGGFSLRSRRLLQALHDPALAARWHHPEDVCIAQTLRPELEQRHGIVFADLALAQRFAFENEPPAEPTFGFHGMYNIARVVGPEAFADLMDRLPDSVITGRDGFKTARALLRDGHPALARRFLLRRHALGAASLRTHWMSLQARLRA